MQMQYYELFEEQVKKSPKKIAVSTEAEQITYEELYEKVNNCASNLLSKGIAKDAIVGVMLDRSIDWVTCVIAILKIGCVYLPISPQYPMKRIEYIVENSNLKFLIVDEKEKYDSINHVLLLDVNCILSQNGINKDEECFYSELCYVIYTSGSTGNPKGVMVKQKGMINHIYAKINDLKLSEEDVIAQNASQCFDISIWQLLTALIIGGRTHIIGDDIINNPRKFIKTIIKGNVSILELVPSYLNVLLKFLNKDSLLLHLRYILSTGEMLYSTLANRWLELFPSIPIVNAYGPTEASDDITHYFLNNKCSYDNVPIGSAIQNMNIYIVNQEMNQCGIGEKGEILVSGIGIAKGYINNIEKTNEVFIDNPFDNESKLYRTGDVGSWIDRRNIMYYGRKDNQVKLNGFRIELDEIDSVLSKIDDIEENISVIFEDENHCKSICSFFVSKKLLNQNTIRESLKKDLPYYMMPSYITQVDAMPLTVNGKVDKNKLIELQINKE